MAIYHKNIFFYQVFVIFGKINIQWSNWLELFEYTSDRFFRHKTRRWNFRLIACLVKSWHVASFLPLGKVEIHLNLIETCFSQMKKERLSFWHCEFKKNFLHFWELEIFFQWSQAVVKITSIAIKVQIKNITSYYDSTPKSWMNTLLFTLLLWMAFELWSLRLSHTYCDNLRKKLS